MVLLLLALPLPSHHPSLSLVSANAIGDAASAPNPTAAPAIAPAARVFFNMPSCDLRCVPIFSSPLLVLLFDFCCIDVDFDLSAVRFSDTAVHSHVICTSVLTS